MNHSEILDQLLCQLIKSRDTNEYTFITVFLLFIFYVTKFLVKCKIKNDRQRIEHDPTS
jgi:hypothetical protein